MKNHKAKDYVVNGETVCLICGKSMTEENKESFTYVWYCKTDKKEYFRSDCLSGSLPKGLVHCDYCSEWGTGCVRSSKGFIPIYYSDMSYDMICPEYKFDVPTDFCNCCGKSFHRGELEEYSSGKYCEDCIEDICVLCGESLTNENEEQFATVYYEGDITRACLECLNNSEIYTECEWCGTWYDVEEYGCCPDCGLTNEC